MKEAGVYILRRPFLICQNNTSDDFDSCESSLSPNSLQLLQDFLLDPLVIGQIANSMALDTNGVSQLLQSGLGRNDDCNRMCFRDRCVNADICNHCG